MTEERSHKRIIKVIAILSILNILDALLTQYLTTNYGTGCEVNPFMRVVMESIGIKLWAVSKIALGTVCLIYVIKRLEGRIISKSFKVVTYCVFISYVFIVVNNFLQIVLN